MQKGLSLFGIYRRSVEVDLFAPPMSNRSVGSRQRCLMGRPLRQIYWWRGVVPLETKGREPSGRCSHRFTDSEIKIVPGRGISSDSDPHLQQAGVDIQQRSAAETPHLLAWQIVSQVHQQRRQF